MMPSERQLVPVDCTSRCGSVVWVTVVFCDPTTADLERAVRAVHGQPRTVAGFEGRMIVHAGHTVGRAVWGGVIHSCEVTS